LWSWLLVRLRRFRDQGDGDLPSPTLRAWRSIRKPHVPH